MGGRFNLEMRTRFEKFKIHINFLNLCEIDNFVYFFFFKLMYQIYKDGKWIDLYTGDLMINPYISKINALERFRDQPSSTEQMPDLFLFHKSTQNWAEWSSAARFDFWRLSFFDRLRLIKPLENTFRRK